MALFSYASLKNTTLNRMESYDCVKEFILICIGVK